MNHDATHCLDYNASCPKKCYRAQLTQDLHEIVYLLPTAWAHFKGTHECHKCPGTSNNYESRKESLK